MANNDEFSQKMQSLTDMLEGVRKNRDGIVLAIGVRDGFEARLLQYLAANAVTSKVMPNYIKGVVAFCSGYLLSASLGLPDMSHIERADVKHFAETVRRSLELAAQEYRTEEIPMIVDIDTGLAPHPFALNYLTCREMHRAGANAIQIEDQVTEEKSCGHMQGSSGKGKQVISQEEMVKKRIKPCLDYSKRTGAKDFSIVARVDSIAPYGLGDAITRGKMYADAGAKILFIEAPKGDEDLTAIAKELKDSKAVLLANMIEYGETQYHSPFELYKMGFGVALYCIGSLFASHNNLKAYMNTLLKGENPLEGKNSVIQKNAFSELNDLLGRQQVERYNKK